MSNRAPSRSRRASRRTARWPGAVVALAVLATPAACGDDTSSTGTVGDELPPVGTELVSTEVLREGEPGLVAGTRVLLTVDDDSLTAQAGCNVMTFDDVTVSDGRLQAGDGSTTDMGCPAELHEQDEWLADFLTSEPTTAWDGDTLRLASGDDLVTLVDREIAEPDIALEGPRWVLDGVIDGDAVSSVPVGLEAYVAFAGGEVNGFTGCSFLSAPVEILDTAIEIGEVVITEEGDCGPSGQRLEDAILRVLDGTVAWEIDSRQLTLTTDAGDEVQGLVFRALER